MELHGHGQILFKYDLEVFTEFINNKSKRNVEKKNLGDFKFYVTF